MSEWTRCSEKLPRKYDFYLVWSARFMRPLIMEYKPRADEVRWVSDRGRLASPTHWMPLPDAPKE